MHDATRQLEQATWAVAEGRATAEERALLEADPAAWRRTLDRLIVDAEASLSSVRGLSGPERERVVADFEDDLARLRALEELLSTTDGIASAEELAEVMGRVQLQASWSAGQVVVWAGGRGTTSTTNDDLADLLEAVGGPAVGWSLHPDVLLPSGARAEALAIPIRESLGWLVAVSGSSAGEDVEPERDVDGPGRAPRRPARRRRRRRPDPARPKRSADGRGVDVVRRLGARTRRREGARGAGRRHARRRWSPSPRPTARATTTAVLGAVVDAIVQRGRRPARAARHLRPIVRTAGEVAEAFTTRLDGSTFRRRRPAGGPGGSPARAVEPARSPRRAGPAWSSSSTRRTPTAPGSCRCSVRAPTGQLLPIEVALGDSEPTAAAGRRAGPARARAPRRCTAPGGLRRGQVVLSQDEAWELMTVTGAELAAAGFEVRVPALSRRKPTPVLRLFAEPAGDSVVGAHQLSNVRWSVVFDDVELTAADVARLAAEARPLVRSRGRWVELDRVDLKEAAAALAERAAHDDDDRRRDPAPRRSASRARPLGAGSPSTAPAGPPSCSRRRRRRPTTRSPGPRASPASCAATRPRRSAGSASSTPSSSAAASPSTWASARRRRRSPTSPATDRTTGRSLGRSPRPRSSATGRPRRPASRPGCGCVVHHGASRASADELAARGRPTPTSSSPPTAPRCATSTRWPSATWDRIVLDEAQAIKNPANETAQQLRRIPARTRVALTGTPIENGLGDLWAILDFTNPGLVGTRPAVHRADGRRGRGRAAGPQRHPRVPPDEERAGGGRRAARPHRRARPLHDDPRADRPLPGRARRPGRRHGRPSRRRPEAGRDPRRHHRAQADLQPPRRLPGRRPAAGRALGQAGPARGDRRVGVRGRRADPHLHPLRRSGASSWPTTSPRSPARRSPATTAASPGPPATGSSPSSRTARAPGALVLSLKAGGTGLNLTAASHVVLYDRWWNPAVEDQARDRAWRIGQTRTVVSHRLVCPGTVDERVEEVVAGKRHIADLVLPKSSSLADLTPTAPGGARPADRRPPDRGPLRGARMSESSERVARAAGSGDR